LMQNLVILEQVLQMELSSQVKKKITDNCLQGESFLYSFIHSFI
jgi:hypothetical protein